MMTTRRPIECADGFSMSVQAGDFLYSCPRYDDAEYYTYVEIGFPSESEELLLPHMECDSDDPTDTVYPYTPAAVVLAVIEKHGGMVGGDLPLLRIEDEEE